MILQEFIDIDCPYCGEVIQVQVDCSIPRQEYIEDCSVCCQPIDIIATVDSEGIVSVRSQSQDDC